MSQRFEMYAGAPRRPTGVCFLRAAVSFVKDRLGLDQDAFLYRDDLRLPGLHVPDAAANADA